MVTFRKVRTLFYIFVSISVLCVLHLSRKRVPTDRITEINLASTTVTMMTSISVVSSAPRALRSAESISVSSIFNLSSRHLHADQPVLPVASSTETKPASTIAKITPAPAVSMRLKPIGRTPGPGGSVPPHSPRVTTDRSTSYMSNKNESVTATTAIGAKTTTGPSASVIPRALCSVMSPAHRASLINVLRRFSEAADAANITYFIYGGTLLGSYRHHGQMPWDDDADVIVASRQKPQLQRMLRSLAPALRFAKSAYTEWKVFARNSNPIATVPWKFPFLDVSFYAVNEKLLWDEGPAHDRLNTFWKADVFPLCRRPFEGMMLPAPRNTRAVLKRFNVDMCVSSNYNHSIEDFIPAAARRSLPCNKLWHSAPFVFRTNTSHGTNETLKIGSTVLSWFMPKS